MKKALVVALMFVGLATVSCNKDDDNNNNTTVTAADLITSGTWKIDTIGFDSDKNGTIDSEIPGGFEACEMDNTTTFNKDSTGVFDESTLKCNDADPQTRSFQWYLKAGSNDSIINISGDLPGQLNGDINILTLTNTSFVLSKHLVLTSPIPIDQNLIVALKK